MAGNKDMKTQQTHREIIIDIDIYEARLIVIISNDVDSARGKYGLEPFNADNVTSYGPDGSVLMFMDDAAKPDAYVHELFHATHMILAGRGIVFDPDSFEAFAYLHGFLYRKLSKLVGLIGNAIRKKKS